MQRLFFSAGHLVQNKPAAALAVCRRGGATATLQTMNMMFEMMNMPVVTSQYWNIAYGAGKGEVYADHAYLGYEHGFPAEENPCRRQHCSKT